VSEFFRDWWVWCYLYLQHFFVMMYWVTIPGLLVCGFLSVRYRPVFRDRLLKGASGPLAVFYAIGLGMTTPASRREGLKTTSTLLVSGAPPAAALGYFIASQSLGLYFVLAFTVLVGLEFGLGVLLGGLVMVLLTAASAYFLALSPVPEKIAPATSTSNPGDEAPKNWQALLSTREGWWLALKDIGHIFRVLWLPSLGGLLLGGLILAVDMRKAWPLPLWLGDEGLGPTIASAFFGPLLSFISFSSSLGNLVVASSIWKTWTFAYAGVISFVLAGTLHPLNLRPLKQLFGARTGRYVATILYLSAALGGLTAIGTFELLGLEVTHVPWFEPLVKKIMMTLPFTMLGTGGMSIMGKMGGMEGM